MNQHISIRVTRRAQVGERVIENSIELDAPQDFGTTTRISFESQREETQTRSDGNGGPEGCATPPTTPTFESARTLERYVKVMPDGVRVPGSNPTTEHVAVIDIISGLMWAVESIGNPNGNGDGSKQNDCIKACKSSNLLGFTDWTLPTRAQLASLIDDTRHEPAIDTNLFPRVKPRWHWTSTPAAWSSASAWFVDFDYGGVSNLRRNLNGFALAVRRVGQ